jgi:hypothetical protein
MKELYTALSKAQSKITGAVKDQNNPFFKSKYADLSSVMDAIRVPFAENGLAYFQGARQLENGNWVLHTKVVHSSGEEIGSDYPIICSKQNDPQAFLSATTYARRASLSAIAGVSQIDDDGNIASQVQRPGLTPITNKVVETSIVSNELAPVIQQLAECKTMNDLKKTWAGISKFEGNFTREEYAELTLMKDKRKGELSNAGTN